VRAGKSKTLSLLAFALGASTLARADYKDDYAHGVKAYKDGQYAQARELLQQALDAHAEPAAKIRLYGQVYDSYLPQHYAGMAAAKLGDCGYATSVWGSAANQQIIGQFGDLAADERATCAGKTVAKIEPPKPALPEKPPEKPPLEDKPPPKEVAINTPPPKPVAPPPPPPPKPVEKPVVAEKAAPPEALVQAFDEYLGGKYVEVARINPDAYTDSHARLHAYLVRAAAKYTQARMAADDALLASAKADAAAARALDAQLTPDATLFSPAFREFYASAK